MKLRKSAYVCMAMLAPGTAPSRGTADFKKALATFHAHVLNFPGRERSYIGIEPEAFGYAEDPMPAVITIHIPPLREHPADIVRLDEHFISKHPKHKRFTSISADAKKCLSEYPWPGNKRELQNAVEHAMVMSREKELNTKSLPIQFRTPTRGMNMEKIGLQTSGSRPPWRRSSE